MGCSASSTVDCGGSFHLSYQLGRKLGEGAFGQVRAAKSKKDGSTDLAVKIIDVRDRDLRGHPTSHTDNVRVAMARQEISMWHLVGSCDNCVSLKSSYFERNLFFLVMQKCDISLMDKLSSSALPEGDLCRIFSEMLAGIRHLHARNIVHRDIKPDNYLLGGGSGTTVKLCDFGMAAQLPKQGVLKGVFGTAPYMSPEMLSAGSGYCLKTDVWSFGASAFLMIHGDFPYVPLEPSVRSMKQAISRGLPSIRFTREVHDEAMFSRSFVDRSTPFLKALLQREPHTRKTAEDAMQLRFLHSDLDGDTAVTLVSDAPVMAPVARKARRASKQEHELSRASRRQSIEQTCLEDLLGMLQEHGADSEVSTTYLSEGDGDITDRSRSRRMDEGRLDDIVVKRSETRLRTPSGVVDNRPESISASTSKASDVAGLTDPRNQNCDDGCPRGSDVAKMPEPCFGVSTSTSVYVQL